MSIATLLDREQKDQEDVVPFRAFIPKDLMVALDKQIKLDRKRDKPTTRKSFLIAAIISYLQERGVK